MTIVCGIDPSLTSAGIAILHNGRPDLLTTVVHTNHDTKDWPHRIRRITSQSQAIIAVLRDQCHDRGTPHRPPRSRINLAVIEAPLTFGPDNSADSYDRYCVFIGVCSQLQAWNVPIAVVHNKTRAKWATGTANTRGITPAQKKREVVAAVHADWPNERQRITNDDIADALTLAAMGALHAGDPLPFPIKPRHHNGLEAVTWPEGVKA